ncbi:MAG: alpha/beta hydrolase [Pseudomonadota bacterium]
MSAAPQGALGLETAAFEAPDRVRLRGGAWPAVGSARGLALLLPGRTEYLEKAAFTAAGLTERGYRVVSLDWRGQGRSARALRRPEKGHVSDFAEYQRDLAALMAHPQLGGTPDLVLAHSMGGTSALLARRDGELGATPLILSAPMLGLAVSGWAQSTVLAMIAFARRTGRLDLWAPLPQAPKAYPLTVRFEDNVLTGDRAVWDWMAASARAEPAFALGAPTLGWLDAARRAMAEIAEMPAPGGRGLMLIGADERVVSAEAVRAAAGRLDYGLAEIPGARHEPLVDAPEPRAAAWAAVDRFLAG